MKMVKRLVKLIMGSLRWLRGLNQDRLLIRSVLAAILLGSLYVYLVDVRQLGQEAPVGAPNPALTERLAPVGRVVLRAGSLESAASPGIAQTAETREGVGTSTLAGAPDMTAHADPDTAASTDPGVATDTAASTDPGAATDTAVSTELAETTGLVVDADTPAVSSVTIVTLDEAAFERAREAMQAVPGGMPEGSPPHAGTGGQTAPGAGMLAPASTVNPAPFVPAYAPPYWMHPGVLQPGVRQPPAQSAPGQPPIPYQGYPSVPWGGQATGGPWQAAPPAQEYPPARAYPPVQGFPGAPGYPPAQPRWTP